MTEVIRKQDNSLDISMNCILLKRFVVVYPSSRRGLKDLNADINRFQPPSCEPAECQLELKGVLDRLGSRVRQQ